MRAPLFLTFEGIDGSGKTTQITRLAGLLEERGRSVRVYREPGGTELGERIRELVLGGGEVVPWAEVSLFAAARAQLVANEIRPALAEGCDVICDRYLDSSVAYQGIARGLGEKAVLDWNLLVTGGLLPDLTFLLALAAEDASLRIAASAAAGDRASPPPDRLERESLGYRQAVERAYAELARRAPQRIVVLDATLQPEAIAALIRDRLHTMLDVAATGTR